MLERHVARAAAEPTPSLQHDGQRRHAAEGHNSEHTRVRHHVRWHSQRARTLAAPPTPNGCQQSARKFDRKKHEGLSTQAASVTHKADLCALLAKSCVDDDLAG